MGNGHLYKIESFFTLGTSESKRRKVTPLNLFHPTASPLFKKSVFSYYDTASWGQRAGKLFMGVDVGSGGFNRSKVLGIIGFGRIGQAVMRRSRGFGVVDRFRRVLFTAVKMRELTKGIRKNLKS